MTETRRAGAARRRALGRGEGQAQHERPVALRRPAAASVHRPRHRHRAGGAADGRAVLGARPDRHPPHRRADARAEEEVHDRHRHAQPAASEARRRSHRRSSTSTRPRAAEPATWSSSKTPSSSSKTRKRSTRRITSAANSAEAVSLLTRRVSEGCPRLRVGLVSKPSKMDYSERVLMDFTETP